MINGDDDPAVTGGCAWEWAVEIDAYPVEMPRWTGQRLEWATDVLRWRLATLAVWARSNKLGDKGIHPAPVVAELESLVGFKDSSVSTLRIGVKRSTNVFTQVSYFQRAPYFPF